MKAMKVNRNEKFINGKAEIMNSTQNDVEREKQVLIVDLKDSQLRKVGEFSMTLTKHSNDRLVQRSISEQALQIALIYGKVFFKQGLMFHVMGENNIPTLVSPQVRKKCKNLVVVVSGDSDEIITTYRSKNPFKHIKKKTKRLSRYNNAA